MPVAVTTRKRYCKKCQNFTNQKEEHHEFPKTRIIYECFDCKNTETFVKEKKK